MKLLYFFLLSLVLTSCGHFADGTSVFAEGGWIVPAFPLVGAVIFAVLSYKQRNSPSKQQVPGGTVFGDPLPWWKRPFSWFAIALAVATLVIIIAFNAAK